MRSTQRAVATPCLSIDRQCTRGQHNRGWGGRGIPFAGAAASPRRPGAEANKEAGLNTNRLLLLAERLSGHDSTSRGHARHPPVNLGGRVHNVVGRLLSRQPLPSRSRSDGALVLGGATDLEHLRDREAGPTRWKKHWVISGPDLGGAAQSSPCSARTS